ncbi:MAG: hypothetical protein WCG52_09670, partial [bacterium]
LLANDEEREQARAQIDSLREAREISRKAVRQTANVLKRTLPEIIRRGDEKVNEEMSAAIDVSDKWLGAADCAQWISIHMLPFGVRAIGKEAENQIRGDLELLDKELNEIANTAVHKMQDDARIKSDSADRFTANITRTVLERVGGAVIGNLLRGMGGAAGAAAGAGNLVKMAVSRAGNLAGKTFSREVYNTIGRTFTKKALARINIAAMITIEAGILLLESNTWKGQLKKRSIEALGKWRDDTIRQILDEIVPAIEKRNMEGVGGFYDDLIDSQKTADKVKGDNLAQRLDKVRSHAQTLHLLEKQLS